MKEPFSLETKRTFMRQLTIDDAENFFNLNLDPDVIKYTGDKPFESVDTARDFLAKYEQYEKYGVRRFAVIEKSTSKFIGWCGLKYNKERKEYDLGFRFFKQYWNQGFATETAQRCLEHGFEDKGFQRIVGRAMKENAASIKVLEKMGMNFIGTFDFDEHEGLLYQSTNNSHS